MILTFIRKQSAFSRCNFKMLNNFQLKGLEIAVSDGMHICPSVRTRCCSLMDEIRILQYWRQVTHPKLLDFSATMMRYYGVFLEFFEYFSEVDRNEIVFHYLYFAEIQYHNHFCLEQNLLVEESTNDAAQNIKRLVPGNVGEDLFKLNPEEPKVVPDIKTRQIYDSFKDEVSSISQYLQELGQKIVSGQRLADSAVKKAAQEKISKAILESSFAVQKKLAHDLQEKAKKANFFSRIGLSTPQITLPSIKPPRIPDFIKFAGMSPEDQQMKQEFDSMGIKVPHYLYNMITIRNYMKKYNKEKNLLKDPFQPNIPNALNAPSYDPNENPKRVPDIPFQKRNIPKIECQKKTNSFFRPFVIANHDKLRYCHDLLDEFFELDVENYLHIQNDLRTSLNRTLDLKKSFYCDMCNFNKQQFFDFHNNRMIFDRGFCLNLLQSNKAYIEFNNITFIRYLDQMLQIKQCFEHGGNAYQFPFITMMHSLVRKIPFFEECFEHLDSEDFYRYCRFICMDYKYHNFSDVIEGHIELYSRAYTQVLAFLTKFTEAQQLTLATIRRQKQKNHIQKIEDILEGSKYLKQAKFQGEASTLNSLIEETEVKIQKIPKKILDDFVDLSITNESLNEYIENFEEYEALNIFEKQQQEPEDDTESYGFQESKLSPEFYLKARSPVKIDDMQPFFAKHQDALDPYAESSLVNFKYNITNLIKDQMQKITIPKIQPSVIKNYLQITEKNLKDFESDVNFEITDKLTKEEKSYVIPMFKPKKVKYRKYRKPRNRSLDWLLPYLEPNNKDDRESVMDQLFHKLPKYQFYFFRKLQ